MAMIEVDKLSKHYGDFIAVNEVSFEVGKGEVVAFLGPNGAGKSTTMKMITGFIAPTSGTASVAGINVQEDRIGAARHLGYLPENGPLYTGMTPAGILKFFGEARGMPADKLQERTEKVIEICELQDVLHKRISKLSRGFRQRVGLANTLLHDPDVLILDEPTSGLDPNQIRHVRDMLINIGKEKTVLLSTHLFQEVDAVATRAIVISDGRKVFDGKPSELKEKGADKGYDEAFYKLTKSA